MTRQLQFFLFWGFFFNDSVWNVDAIKLFMADRHTEDQTDPNKQLRWLKRSCTQNLFEL